MNAKILTTTLFTILAMIAWRTSVPAQPHDTAQALQTRIEALRPTTVAWRKIQWKSCLLEGLKESRARKKPLLVWVFIDRPVDDARC